MAEKILGIILIQKWIPCLKRFERYPMERQKKNNELLKIVREDNPWIWEMHPVNFVLSHQWNYPAKIYSIANNTLKYNQIDSEK
ncbi:hypothetical protein [Candidatus Coxiella mudrowiae]|uniref:hypothetical protein n=1 Tax=Candidatus Coxiella mudrowiae TaxID=2054173 RepID=UPI001F15B058|nr:hypothetical protein [Candidatus Coxiella mudrowiae]